MATSPNPKNANYISTVRQTAKAIMTGGSGGIAQMTMLYQQWQTVYGPGGSAPVTDSDFTGANVDANTAMLTSFFTFWATIVAALAANGNAGLTLAYTVGR